MTIMKWRSANLAAAALSVAMMAVPAQAQSALTGLVSSAEEGMMEGVVVSAKREGSTITVSVVTDANGRYSFRATNLDLGRYALSIRAVGYELAAPASADVTVGKVMVADLKLVKTKDLSAQLTNAEWFLSMPGSDAQKKALLNCTGCHTLERIVKSRHTPEEFMQVFDRMQRYFAGTMPGYPQLLPEGVVRELSNEAKAVAEYLSTVNLSKSETLPFALKTLPRPKGRATRVVITEYDLPRSRSSRMTCCSTATASSGSRISAKRCSAGSIPRPARTENSRCRFPSRPTPKVRSISRSTAMASSGLA